MRWRAAVVVAAVTTGVVAVPARAAQTTTTCSFGGPAGTSRVIALDLPTGSDVLSMRFTSTRPTRAASGHDNWHLAQAIVVIDATTHELVASHVRNEGNNPRRIVAGGMTVDVPGPDTPFVHEKGPSVPGLAPGSYLVVAFGSDGSAAAPNDQWGGTVQVGGTHDCRRLDSGAPFDVDHTDFTGGTVVAVPGAAAVDGASYSKSMTAAIVVGFIDASVQGPGDARIDYTHPTATGSVSDDIEPFVSTGGAYTWTATLHGAAAASIVGLGVDP